jgi:DNA polymerase-3 subunit epsilon
MTMPPDKNVLFVDTETTGKLDFRRPFNSPGQPRIIQLAAIATNSSGARFAQMSVLIQPDGWEIPAEAQAIHGISTDKCRADGIPILAALELLAGMARCCGIVVAHNLDFDRTMIWGEMELASHAPISLPGYCTMKAATDLVQIPGRYGSYKWPTLTETYHHFFKKGFDGAHDALADVVACAECYFEIVKAAKLETVESI